MSNIPNIYNKEVLGKEDTKDLKVRIQNFLKKLELHFLS